jgi:TPR repeat protein/GTP-binding protein EngB required for normal cell division
MANSGDKEVQFRLGLLHFKEIAGFKSNENDGIEWLLKAAKQNHQGALLRLIELAKGSNRYHLQYVLAQLYEEGEGVDKNYREAVQWYELSAAENKTEVSLPLGLLYERGGYGIEKDEHQAIQHYQTAVVHGNKAAEVRLIELANKESRNHPQAQYVLGDMHLRGERVEQNYQACKDYWLQAARQGHKSALVGLIGLAENGDIDLYYNLALLYEQGTMSVEPDIHQAIEWFFEAACQRHKDAITQLAILAERSEAQAQYRMGFLYRDGVIVIDKPHKAAEVWFERVKENPKANEALKKEASELSESVKAKAYAERFYEDIFPVLNKANEQSLALVVGRTGAGKSTLINALLGHKFKYVEDAKGEWSMQVTDPSIPHAMMGQGRSVTRVPGLFSVANKAITLCDLPGFSDTESRRREEHRFHLALLLSGMAKAIQAVLVVIDYTSLEEARGEGCKSLLSELDEIMNDTHAYEQCVFVVNMKEKSNRRFTSKQLVENSLKILIRVFQEDLSSIEDKNETRKIERKIAFLEKIKESTLVWESFEELDFPQKALDKLDFKKPIPEASFRPMLQEATKQTYLSYLNRYVLDNLYQRCMNKTEKEKTWSNGNLNYRKRGNHSKRSLMSLTKR